MISGSIIIIYIQFYLLLYTLFVLSIFGMDIKQSATVVASTTTINMKAYVQSFRQSLFQPTLYAQNRHWQTIVGSGALSQKFFGPPERPFDVIEERIETKDNDFFDVEYKTDFETSSKVVILLHGLESNTKGGIMTKLTVAFQSKGFACCLVSFRSCNGIQNRNPGAYHLGFTDDLKQLVDIIHNRYPTKSIYLTGFSLGANVVLKFLGELSETAHSYHIRGAAVMCVPFDPEACQKIIDKGFSKLVYTGNFLNTLKRKAEVQHALHPTSFDLNAVLSATTMGEFDNAFIAKIYGFKDNIDYYRQTGAKRWLRHIRVPTIAMNARDDPFFDEKALPCAVQDVGDLAPVRMIYHEYGGHCGFYTQQKYMGYDQQQSLPTSTPCIGGDPDISSNRDVEHVEYAKVPVHGWLAEELARILEYFDHFPMLPDVSPNV